MDHRHRPKTSSRPLCLAATAASVALPETGETGENGAGQDPDIKWEEDDAGAVSPSAQFSRLALQPASAPVASAGEENAADDDDEEMEGAVEPPRFAFSGFVPSQPTSRMVIVRPLEYYDTYAAKAGLNAPQQQGLAPEKQNDDDATEFTRLCRRQLSEFNELESTLKKSKSSTNAGFEQAYSSAEIREMIRAQMRMLYSNNERVVRLQLTYTGSRWSLSEFARRIRGTRGVSSADRYQTLVCQDPAIRMEQLMLLIEALDGEPLNWHAFAWAFDNCNGMQWDTQTEEYASSVEGGLLRTLWDILAKSRGSDDSLHSRKTMQQLCKKMCELIRSLKSDVAELGLQDALRQAALHLQSVDEFFADQRAGSQHEEALAIIAASPGIGPIPNRSTDEKRQRAHLFAVDQFFEYVVRRTVAGPVPSSSSSSASSAVEAFEREHKGKFIAVPLLHEPGWRQIAHSKTREFFASRTSGSGAKDIDYTTHFQTTLHSSLVGRPRYAIGVLWRPTPEEKHSDSFARLALPVLPRNQLLNCPRTQLGLSAMSTTAVQSTKQLLRLKTGEAFWRKKGVDAEGNFDEKQFEERVGVSFSEFEKYILAKFDRSRRDEINKVLDKILLKLYGFKSISQKSRSMLWTTFRTPRLQAINKQEKLVREAERASKKAKISEKKASRPGFFERPARKEQNQKKREEEEEEDEEMPSASAATAASSASAVKSRRKRRASQDPKESKAKKAKTPTKPLAKPPRAPKK
jgi:hypothetical protein